MTQAPPSRHKYVFIGFCIVLMIAAVYITGESFREGQPEVVTSTPLAETASPSRLKEEVSGFVRANQALGYLTAPETPGVTRDLATFYSRRAYPGAPPIIPHDLDDDQSMGGKACLTCHADGGFVEKFNAYTPVVPHPELINCRQCHVPVKNNGLFKTTGWVKPAPPVLPGGALEGSPPPIPHGLAMRANCLACHGGPGAVATLRVTHPQRINCRQCHVVAEVATAWQRPEPTP